MGGEYVPKVVGADHRMQAECPPTQPEEPLQAGLASHGPLKLRWAEVIRLQGSRDTAVFEQP